MQREGRLLEREGKLLEREGKLLERDAKKERDGKVKGNSREGRG